MSFLGKIFASSAAQPIEAVGNVLDKLFTSDDEKLDKKLLFARLAQEPSIAQIELNKVEAQHKSRFTSGWRPFIGWVCGIALLYNFIIRDIVSYILIINNPVKHLSTAQKAKQAIRALMLGKSYSMLKAALYIQKFSDAQIESHFSQAQRIRIRTMQNYVIDNQTVFNTDLREEL